MLAELPVTAYPFIWIRVGPPAAAIREPRQARKGAAATVMLGAGVWLARILLLIDVLSMGRAGLDQIHELSCSCTKMAA